MTAAWASHLLPSRRKKMRRPRSAEHTSELQSLTKLRSRRLRSPYTTPRSPTRRSSDLLSSRAAKTTPVWLGPRDLASPALVHKSPWVIQESGWGSLACARDDRGVGVASSSITPEEDATPKIGRAHV